MKIILQKTVPHLGLIGDVVDVSPGYYRNYLGPRNLAFLADPKSIKQLEHQKKIVETKKAKAKKEALELQEKLEATPFKITHLAGKGEKLFGSVTNQEIVALLKAGGFSVDRKFVQIEAPIKTLGEHQVGVKIHPEVVARVKIEIVGKQEEKKEEVTEKEVKKKVQRQQKVKEKTEEKIETKPAETKAKTKSKTATKKSRQGHAPDQPGS